MTGSRAAKTTSLPEPHGDEFPLSQDISAFRKVECELADQVRFVREILDSVSAHVAVLDSHGRIREVNAAWRNFSCRNPPPGGEAPRHTDIGADYLAVCRNCSGDRSTESAPAADGIERVLRGDLECFELEYPCHSPTEQHWFVMQVTPLREGSGGAVVAHYDVTQRKLTERAIHDYSRQLQLALSSVSMGVWTLHLGSERVEWSPEIHRILGVAEFDGRLESFRQLVHPADREPMETRFRENLARGESFQEEFRVVRPDGSVRWIANVAQAEMGTTGTPEVVIGTVYDVTERRRMEQERHRQVEGLELLANVAAELLAAVSPEELTQTIFRKVSAFLDCDVLLHHRVEGECLELAAAAGLEAPDRAAVARFAMGQGLCGTAALGRSSIYHSHLQQSTDPVTQAARGIGMRAYCCEPLFAGTELLGTLAFGSRRRDELTEHDREFIRTMAQSFAMACARLRDITDRIQAQEEFYRLWTHSPDPLCVLGFDGFLLQVNPAWGTLLGWSSAELMQTAWVEFVHPDDRAAMSRVLEKLGEGEPIHGFESRFRGRDGAYRCFTWNSIPLPSSRIAYGFLRDVTEEKRLAEQFRQAQKMEAIGQLAGGVAHDFNNLLTVINGYAEILLTSVSLPEWQQEQLSQIREAGERAAGLTAQLLSFSRKAIVEPRLLNPNQVVESATKLLRRLIGEDIVIETKLRGDAVVKIDPNQLEQVLMNLAVNARDSMPQGGRLIIATELLDVPSNPSGELVALSSGQYVLLSVTDTGKGMSDEVRSRVFEPFFTTKGVGKGTGLGLATVYGIVRQAGGMITVESQLGVGSIFRLYFPLATDSPPFLPPRPREIAPRGVETVLLVEDEEGIRRLAKTALEMQGFQVFAAAKGAEAVDTSRSHSGRIDILVTDIVLPDLGGQAVADAVRADRPETRVLYMSGYATDAILCSSGEPCADPFIQKPFTPMTLARKVREALDAPLPDLLPPDIH